MLPGHFEAETLQQTTAGYLAAMELAFAKEDAVEVFGNCGRKMLPDGLVVRVEQLGVGSDMEVLAESPAAVGTGMCTSRVVDTAAAGLGQG